MKRTTRKFVKKAPAFTIVSRQGRKRLRTFFAEQAQLLLPALELLDTGKRTIASVMNEAGYGAAELLLKLSTQKIGGEKMPAVYLPQLVNTSIERLLSENLNNRPGS